ncbi:hypothetical protein V1477_015243, partial [Vespula maculifrons]
KFIYGSPYAATSLWWDPEIGIANHIQKMSSVVDRAQCDHRVSVCAKFIDSTIHRINDNFNQLHDIIQPPTRGTSVLEPSQNFLSSNSSGAHHAEDERSLSARVTGCIRRRPMSETSKNLRIFSTNILIPLSHHAFCVLIHAFNPGVTRMVSIRILVCTSIFALVIYAIIISLGSRFQQLVGTGFFADTASHNMSVSNSSKNFASNENIRYIPYLLNLAKDFEFKIETHLGRVENAVENTCWDSSVPFGECSNAVVRARSKKWLCAEEAPTYCGSRGQLSTTSHFSKVVGMSNPSLMACGLIKIPFTLYHVDTYARSSLFLDGDDGPFHLLATTFRTRVREKLEFLRLIRVKVIIFSYKNRVTLVKYCVDVRGLQQHCTQECIWIPKHVDF